MKKYISFGRRVCDGDFRAVTVGRRTYWCTVRCNWLVHKKLGFL